MVRSRSKAGGPGISVPQFFPECWLPSQASSPCGRSSCTFTQSITVTPWEKGEVHMFPEPLRQKGSSDLVKVLCLCLSPSLCQGQVLSLADLSVSHSHCWLAPARLKGYPWGRPVFPKENKGALTRTRGNGYWANRNNQVSIHERSIKHGLKGWRVI